MPVKHLTPLVHQQTSPSSLASGSDRTLKIIWSLIFQEQPLPQLQKMGESHAPERKCEEGVEERVGKFEMVDKGEEAKQEGEKAALDINLMDEDERIEKAKQKVKLWLTNNFGEPDIIELMIPAR